MLILGIGAYSHESSACLVKDGVPLAFVEEERVNREKHTWRFPEGAIREILQMTGAMPSDIDAVTFFWNPLKEIAGNLKHVVRHFPKSLNLLSVGSGSQDMGAIHRILRQLNLKKTLLKALPEINPRIPIRFVDHHLAHAASCFFVSPFERAAIMTLDGRGERSSAFWGMGEGNSIIKRMEWPVPHSVGHFYNAVTDFLGFKPFYDEYKVMGLSAYGTDRYYSAFNQIAKITKNHTLKLDMSFFSFHTHGRGKWLSGKFYEQFGPPRHPEEDITERHCDIAYALQSCVEDIAVQMAIFLKKETGMENLVLAGGVIQNCQMNRKIAEQSGFKNFFFHPVSNDAGCSLGSALYYTHVTCNRPRNYVMDTVYLGPEYSDDAIKHALENEKLSYCLSDDIAKDCAGHLYAGNIVGWFQGRMECGPRALGNRSIIADPGNRAIRDRLNRIIKQREMFRPFAASVLSEYADDFFEMPADSPFMQLAVNIRKGRLKQIPAVSHKDGTTRVQTVNKYGNPLYRELIECFQNLSGLPLILNTSFNVDEPIVMTPLHAIQCFIRSGLDILVIGNYIVQAKT